MNYLFNVKEIIRTHRCDQCTQSHIKCDRQIPKCSSCIKRNLECTLDRKLVYPKLKGTNKWRGVSNLVKKSVKIDLKNQPQAILKLPKDYGYSYSVLGVFHKFPRKSVLENLTNLIQNPSPFIPNQGISLFLTLTQKLDLLILKPKKELIKPKLPSIIPTNINNVLKQAFDNYFIYNNKILPLFDETEFQFTTKSQSLQITILVCGLSWMEQTPEVKALMSFFEVKLFALLSKVHRIKSSLTMIQVVLIAITSLSFFPWVISIKEILLAHCYRSSFILQLNQAPKWLSRSLRKERATAYTILHMVYNVMLLTFGSFVAKIDKPYELIRLYKCYQTKIERQGYKFYHVDQQVKQYCLLKLIGFYYDLGELLFSFRLFKHNYLDQQMDPIHLGVFAFKLSQQLTLIKDNYITFYDDILSFLQNQSLITAIINYQHSIHLFFHFNHFLLFSIQFCHPKFQSLYQTSLNNNIPLLGPNYLSLALSECYSVIEYAILLNRRYTLDFDASLIAFCLVFMVRHGDKEGKNQAMTQKGLNFLKALGQLPCTKLVAQINLRLIQIILEYLKAKIK